MCGRYVSATPPEETAAYFGAAPGPESPLMPSYNVAPTNDVYAVRQTDDGTRSLDALRWGLIPVWAKEAKVGNRMINARAETVATKNAYRSAFKKRRCLIPADSFYEWITPPGGGKRQPVNISRPDGEPYAFAGLWETWKGPDRSGSVTVNSCTIITTEANQVISEIHHRMPVVLPPSAWSAWLNPDNHDVSALESLLLPAPDALFQYHPVSTDVNNPRNKGSHLLDPVDPDTLPPPEEAEQA